MNSKQMKPIRRKARHILVAMVAVFIDLKKKLSKINYKNVFDFMPNQTHYYDSRYNLDYNLGLING